MSAPTSTPQKVSAYVPCYNNAATIAQTIEGIRSQIHPVDELFVVDDGSTDNSVEIIERLGVRVLHMEKNMGRGTVRALALETTRNEFVLCCDATNSLAPNFLELALKWFDDEKVLAVFGRWWDPNPRGLVDRWRARHLFQQDIEHQIARDIDLSTHGTLMRRSAVMSHGNFDRNRRNGEDFHMGIKLRAAGIVVYDPALEVHTVVRNTLYQVMERYARWNRATLKSYSLTDFVDSHIVAWKIMIPRDVRARDWLAIPISASVPYFSIALAEKRSMTFPPRNLEIYYAQKAKQTRKPT